MGQLRTGNKRHNRAIVLRAARLKAAEPAVGPGPAPLEDQS